MEHHTEWQLVPFLKPLVWLGPWRNRNQDHPISLRILYHCSIESASKKYLAYKLLYSTLYLTGRSIWHRPQIGWIAHSESPTWAILTSEVDRLVGVPIISYSKQLYLVPPRYGRLGAQLRYSILIELHIHIL